VNRPYEGITIDNFADWTESGWSSKGDRDRDLTIMALGLAGETGETVDIIKKYIRGSGDVNRTNLILEMGDVLHYWCRLARHFDLDIGDIMRDNIAKIEGRRGTRSFELKETA
jgi:NTP pyrophosphatase (non-canonical NTP hydrolase)